MESKRMDGTYGPRLLDGGDRPAPWHVKVARATLLITVVTLLLVSGVAMYAFGEFLPDERLYGLANQVAVLTCALLIGAPAWIALSGHLRKHAYKRPVAYTALGIGVVALFGGLSWKSTVQGGGWLLHQAAPVTVHTRTYTVDRRLRLTGNRSFICDDGVRIREHSWPFNVLCGLSYQEYQAVQPGDKIIVRGATSEHGFLMHSYTISDADN